jgi:nitronate monooxygenase
MKWPHQVARMAGIEHPFIQAPMLGVTTPQMVAAVSNAGGLGSLPVGGLSPADTASLIQAVRKLTGKPFAVNLFAHSIPALLTHIQLDEMHGVLEQYYAELGIELVKQPAESMQFYTYADQIEVLLQEKVRIVSFTFGVLNDAALQALKKQGVLLMGTATCVREAVMLQDKGIDIIVAQGMEAGGHRGSFLNERNPPLIGTMALVPQVVDAVQRPVIAAGGIADGRGVAAALMLGAAGVQVGTAFVTCDESSTSDLHKQTVLHAADTDTVLTNVFTGRWARGVRNRFITEMEQAGLSIADYPVQNQLTAPMRKAASRENNKEFLAMWAGQFVPKTDPRPAADILRSMIQQAEELLP